MLRQIIEPLVDLVYPPQCLLCQNALTQRLINQPLCKTCLSTIVLNRPPFCLGCSRPLTDLLLGPRCQNCARHELAFDFAWSASLYEEPVKSLLHLFKYSGRTGLRFPFAQIMIDFIKDHNLDIAQFDCVVPIPLFASRFRERGYNQAFLLAKEISQHFQLPLEPQGLCRSRPTLPQSLLDKKKRWTNVEGAFRINQLQTIKGQSVLLIDDLLTTGATASSAALCLKAHKAKRVGVLTLSITTE